MPSLKVNFEIDAANAAAAGAKSGQQWSNAFRDKANQYLATEVPKDLINVLGKTGWGSDAFTTPIKQMSNKIADTLEMTLGQRFKRLAFGLGAAPFSSWIGARLLSDAAFGGRGGKGGGGGSGLLGAGGASGFAEFYIAIEAFKKVLEYGTEMFRKVIDKGFELYTKAAQLHLSVGQLFSVQAAAQMVGLTQTQIDQFLLRNQWGKARTSLQNFSSYSELGGLSKQFEDAYKWSQEIAGTWQLGSEAAYNMRVDLEKFKTDWLTLWNNSGLIKFLDSVTKWADAQLHSSNVGNLQERQMQAALQFASAHNLTLGLGAAFKGEAAVASSATKWLERQFGAPETLRYGFRANGGQSNAEVQALSHQFLDQWNKTIGQANNPAFNFQRQLPQMSHFEKMGFVIGGGRSTKSLLEESNRWLQSIATTIAAIQTYGAGMGGGGSHGHAYPGSSGAMVNTP